MVYKNTNIGILLFFNATANTSNYHTFVFAVMTQP